MNRGLFIPIGVLAALLTGAVVLFFLGTVLAFFVTVLLLALAIYASRPSAKARPMLQTSLVALFVLSLATAVYGFVTVASAFGDLSGLVEPPDQQALASAQAKFDEEAGAGFRLELTEEEIAAVVQDGVAELGAPFRRVDIDIVGGEDEGGHVAFELTFRNGDLSMRGRFGVALEAGAIRAELLDVHLGVTTVPGVARGALEDLINPFADQALAKSGTEFQSVALLDDKVVVIGTRAGSEILSSKSLLSGLQIRAARTVEVPPERLGPGVVNESEAQGSSYYVALGDSLAAGVGVTQPREGYVSRFHNQLQRRDGVQYGLRNFGVSGETSASLIRGGQLDQALEFIRFHDVRYITIDIGANDLLGHLGSADCSAGLSAPGCQQRIADASAAYEVNLDRILRALREAAPGTTLIFLQTYNPFSLGFGSRVALEGDTNRTLSEFNDLAARVAQYHGVLVADGLTPMKGTTAGTTHMLDDPPDIHPRAIGYDLLAAALLDALP